MAFNFIYINSVYPKFNNIIIKLIKWRVSILAVKTGVYNLYTWQLYITHNCIQVYIILKIGTV